MSQRLAPSPVDLANVPRDHDWVRPDVFVGLDGLLEPHRRAQGDQARPAPAESAVATVPATTPQRVPGLALLAFTGVVAAATLALGRPAPVPQPIEPSLAPFVLSTLVSDGFALLDTDRGGAAQAFRRVLAARPDHGPALLGLGVASIGTDGDEARKALCAAAAHGGVVGLSAQDLLAQRRIDCDGSR